MKNIIILLITVISPFCLIASPADIFRVDETKLESELYSINQLEVLVVQHMYLNYTELLKINPDIIELDTELNMTSDTTIKAEPPFGIPSFVWGFCLSIPGVVLVYTMTGDQDELKRSMLGCILGTGIIGGFYSCMYGLSSW